MTPSLVLVQLAVIQVVWRGLRWLLGRLRQPAVVCQMLAGIVLGPSLMGAWSPWHAVFPASSTGVIAAISQIALVLFMFAAGTELDLRLVRRRAGSAAAIALASVLVPLAAGVAVAAWLVHDTRLFPQDVAPAVEIGFLGVALAITAFPVMVRIIAESGLTSTAVGSTALAAGAFTDLAAWCMLAVLLAMLSNTPVGTAGTLAAALALAGLVAAARRPPAERLIARTLERRGPVPALPAAVLVALLLVAWLSDWSGLHPAFGAFMVGLAMPRGEQTKWLRQAMEPIVGNLLLPLYFVSAGLDTSVGLVTGSGLLAIAVVLLLTACLTKGLTCWLAARCVGSSSRDALIVGALMNARGLVELVVLGIGLQRHVITPALFSIMVVIALVTSMLAGPVIALVDRTANERLREVAPAATAG